MPIDAATVKRVAKLARLALPEAKAAPMAEELSAIMA